VPNTLAQLNAFSNQSYAFEDARAYSITFSANVTTNQSVSVGEDQSWLSPVGINITGMTSQLGNITYNIDTSNISGNAILTWPTLPSSVSSSSPSTGVYQVTGFIDNVVWDQIKSPTIVAKDRETNFVYSANIVYPDMDGSTISEYNWNIDVTISNTHSEMSNATNFTYDEDTPKTIPGTPTITDVYSGPLPHTLVITPNVANAVFSLSMSGNTSLDPVTKALTIVDTKANINTGLGNLWLVPASNTNLNYSLNYSLTNPVSNLNTQVNQLANIGNTYADFTTTTSYSYAEDVATRLVFAVDDGDATATTFTIAVDQNLGTNGTFLVNGVDAGTGNAASFTGNRTAFNGANITFVPYPDTTDTIGIITNVYMANVSGNATLASNVVSTINNTSGHAQYALGGGYTENTLFNFANIITDTDPLATSYTIGLQQTAGNIGQWYVNGNLVGYANSVYSVSNTRANINSSNISWLPLWQDRGNVQFTYNQTKVNSVFGNITQASNVGNTKTCVATVPGFTNNIVPREFPTKDFSNLLTSPWIAMDDGSDVGQTYEVTITLGATGIGNTPAGAIAANATAALAKLSPLVPTYTITGNTVTINNLLTSAVFAPLTDVETRNPNVLTYSLSYQRDGVPDSNPGNNPRGNSMSGVVSGNVINIYTANTTFTPTQAQLFYYNNIAVLAVGGGGAGAINSSGIAGGGGGGGGANLVTGAGLANVNYNVTVGAGGIGANGADSQVSYANSTSIAIGGFGYLGSQATAGRGGPVGTPQSGPPFSYTTGLPSDAFGGGGAGAGGSGGNATGIAGGVGGAGYNNSIFIENINPPYTYYGNGGAGGSGNSSSSGANAVNYGGGGDGGGSLGGVGGSGANGIVIIKVVRS
jgi:hypothetical protein